MTSMKQSTANGETEGIGAIPQRAARLGLLALTMMAAVLSGCASETSDPFYEDRIVVEDQSVAEGEVLLKSVETNSPGGWAVVRRDNGSGAPLLTEVIGRAHIDFGTNSEITIDLTEAVAAGEVLWIILHHDTGVSGTFDYSGEGSADPPVEARGSSVVVMESFTTM